MIFKYKKMQKISYLKIIKNINNKKIKSQKNNLFRFKYINIL